MTVEALVRRLGLAPHPEGGFYRETFRSPVVVQTPRGPRAASTAIWFLLPGGAFSAWHRVASEEVWHHYDGDPVTLHTLSPEGDYRAEVLGHDVDAGQAPQRVVPAGTWQAASCEGAFALCGCTVAPGFEFSDFELADRASLAGAFPAHAGAIERFTRG